MITPTSLIKTKSANLDLMSFQLSNARYRQIGISSLLFSTLLSNIDSIESFEVQVASANLRNLIFIQNLFSWKSFLRKLFNFIEQKFKLITEAGLVDQPIKIFVIEFNGIIAVLRTPENFLLSLSSVSWQLFNPFQSSTDPGQPNQIEVRTEHIFDNLLSPSALSSLCAQQLVSLYRRKNTKH